MVVMALAKLSFTRPGFDDYLQGIADKLHGAEMYGRFKLTGLEEAGVHVVPKRIAEALEHWVKEATLPGQFLQAVLRNDLLDAIGRADDECLATFKAIILWLCNVAPSTCWGSPQAVEYWLTVNDRKRERVAAQIYEQPLSA